MLGREAQVSNEVLEVVLQALDGGRVQLAPLGGEGPGPVAGDGLGGCAGCGVEVVEDAPELGLDLRLSVNGHLSQYVAGPVDEALLA